MQQLMNERTCNGCVEILRQWDFRTKQPERLQENSCHISICAESHTSLQALSDQS